MTDKPKESAEEFLKKRGIAHFAEFYDMIENKKQTLSGLLESYAQSLLSAKLKEQRKICFDRWKDASGFSNMPEVIKRAIVYAPEPL